MTGEYIAAYDVWVQYEKGLPSKINGVATTYNEQQIAIINDSLSDEEKIKAVAHEIKHHQRGDLFKDESVVDIENAVSA